MSNLPVRRESAGPAVILTIDRPDRLNALDAATIDVLQAAFDDIEEDTGVRAVILTGAGDRAFSAGADIHGIAASLRRGTDAAVREVVRRGQGLTRRIETFPKPVIVAVNGLALGGGCEITEAAPLAIASEHARFGKPEIRLGFPPPFGGTQRLPRLIGRKRALAMILTAQPIDAHEAARIGLVNAVVPHARLRDEALALANAIAAMPRLAVAACLASVTRGINLSIDEGLAVEAVQFARAAGSADAREGVAAFVEKRAPVFVGA
ncbi:MAG: enoyl-CoA hydratase/isomerase family protein [Alphaproteobacteria bacterium]|nr:enoyl-CoA hydratase/isomerase family protein [Alphaproteobacteria bacterium]